jgi:hypothetical protein
MNRGVATGLLGAWCTLLACSSSALVSPAPDGAVDMMSPVCGTDPTRTGTCNSLSATGPAVTVTCLTGTLPTGQGGTVVEGRYDLTELTYYNTSSCPTEPVTETLDLTSTCLLVASSTPSASSFSATLAETSGHSFVTELTCLAIPASTMRIYPDVDEKTFSATATTLTLFTQNSAAGNPNPDSVAVFTKQ